jgi:glycosyltransferase involved in cell wall biosynthesis
MKILLDYTQIPRDRAGVGVYAENLVRELRYRLSPDDELLILMQKDEVRIREMIRGFPNIHPLTLPFRCFRNRAALMLFEQLAMPLLLLVHRIDVAHFLHYTHPILSPCPIVVTIHDLTFLLHPEYHTRSRLFVMTRFIRRALKHADALIFVSDSTRSDAERLFPVRKGSRTVVPLGVDPEPFRQDNPRLIDAMLSRLSITRPFLLFLGTIEPRKNVLRLIRSFEFVARERSDLILVLAGKAGWLCDDVFDAIKTSEYRNRIRYLGFISDPDKRALLAACHILVYPSLYEGFGLPVLEAFAARAPVITSNVSSLPEVAGEAAILVDPCSVESLTGAILELLSDDSRGEHLRTLGTQQLQRFTWGNLAQKTYQVYQQAACSHSDTRSADHPE